MAKGAKGDPGVAPGTLKGASRLARGVERARRKVAKEGTFFLVFLCVVPDVDPDSTDAHAIDVRVSTSERKRIRMEWIHSQTTDPELMVTGLCLEYRRAGDLRRHSFLFLPGVAAWLLPDLQPSPPS